VRRILPIALAAAVIVATFAGVASARLSILEPVAATAAPFTAPVEAPAADPAFPGSYGFSTSDELAAALGSDATAAGAPAASGGASATVTVTATVLPVVFIVVDEDGAVTALFTNTPERDVRGVLYLVREGAEDGEPRELDAATWARARVALAAAHEGTGTIWSA
jgi:hypothetical protein